MKSGNLPAGALAVSGITLAILAVGLYMSSGSSEMGIWVVLFIMPLLLGSSVIGAVQSVIAISKKQARGISIATLTINIVAVPALIYLPGAL